MTKLQNLFVALVNMDIFRMPLTFSLFTVDYFLLKHCEYIHICRHAECLQMYTVSAPFEVLLNFP